MEMRQIAGGVVVGPDGRVLVVSQKGTSWSLPKGHVEAGEGALAAARREIVEETGITTLEYIRSLGCYQRNRIGRDGVGEIADAPREITLFLFRTDQTALAPQDPENPEARWVPKEQVANLLTHPKDKEFFRSIVPLFEIDT
jgi:8-oxo-dGTP pyrophosphatase MutT (NUDIX family)